MFLHGTGRPRTPYCFVCVSASGHRRTLKPGRGLLTVSGGFGLWPRAQRPQDHRVTASDASQVFGMLNFAVPRIWAGRLARGAARLPGACRRCVQCGDPPLLDSIHTHQLWFVKETSLPCLSRVAGSTSTSNDPTTDFCISEYNSHFMEKANTGCAAERQRTRSWPCGTAVPTS
ncbi:hypothetical protein PHLGIDRAFT_293566 [Phlebiopsis gigantea 11061_1 CR5-6]|uniref:Uncharacterized protein n=1 Tax=Phlebiopsis gigantea (strain 11061_1 CR5-6) TaxID=745531 RepID=A0A0C3S0G2_PHLG1|nr:hypothetical protein PHLGIDRAFT_293566 [Phlebiopsis gigantea 11061_1 CR5-6]